MIRSITDMNVAGKRVLTRVDFNVPQDEAGVIIDDTRITESLPTIRTILDGGGIAVLMSHLGRPKGMRKAKYSLRPVAAHLAGLLPGVTVRFADDCIGPLALTTIEEAKPGEIVVLENLRFYAEEEANDPAFCRQLAVLGDIYCNDAFGTAHRAHASTTGVATLFKDRCAGMLLMKELDYFGVALANPKRPFVAIIGGSKISGKIDVIRSLMASCDTIIIGGGMMFTFLKAQGLDVGDSLVENDKVELARQLLEEAATKNTPLLIPDDAVVATAFSNDAQHKVVHVSDIRSGWMGLDIGPVSVRAFETVIRSAGTILWNGPMGVFELPNFAAGTKAIAEAMAAATAQGAVTIVGGGDSAAAIAEFGHKYDVTHVSTGGGASLEFLEGRVLPGVAALDVP